MGSNGVHPQNCSRDLCHLVEEVLGEMLVEPAVFDLPMMVTKGDEVGPMTVEHAIVDPHVWFANHYEHLKDDFKTRFLGADGSIDKFWSGVRPNDPRRVGNPNFARADLRAFGIPAGQ